MNEKLLFWIGEQPSPVKKDRSSDLVMDSVINYYDSDRRKPAYHWGQLFLDNGAFTARMRGVSLDRKITKTLWREAADDYRGIVGLRPLQLVKTMLCNTCRSVLQQWPNMQRHLNQAGRRDRLNALYGCAKCIG